MEASAVSNAADSVGLFERIAAWIGGNDEATAALLILLLTPLLRFLWLAAQSAYRSFADWLAWRIVRVDFGLPPELPIQCLIIRYGSDAYLEKLASDRERFEGRLRFKILKSKPRRDTKGQISSRVIRMKVHRRLLTQFKLFYEVDSDPEKDGSAELLRKKEVVAEVTTSRYGPRTKVWILLANYPQAVAVDAYAHRAGGWRNNLYFPV